MKLSARLDQLVDRASRLNVDMATILKLEAAAAIVAERMTEQDRRQMERARLKRGKKKGFKIWVEVTAQPTKHRGAYLGRASFHWSKDTDKKKISVNIGVSKGSKLRIAGKKLMVKPLKGEQYEYGAKKGEGGAGGEGAEGAEGKSSNRKPKTTEENPKHDADGDGVADAARVGLPGFSLAPPPALPKLPGDKLTDDQRKIEADWNEAIEGDPKAMAARYAKGVLALAEKKGEPPTFVTDDVKFMHPDYLPAGMDVKNSPPEVMAWRAKNNVLLHQGANAVAKQAFLTHLDELAKLPDGDPKKSVLVTSGGCGCHAAGTMVMLSDGSKKAVEQVQIGDKLMGPDSKPREVQCTIQGKGPMYIVWPTKGQPFTVNDQHVLSLRTNRYGSRRSYKSEQATVEMTVKDFLARGKSFQRLSYLYRTGVDFAFKPVAVDPYFLGLWLGDGTHCNASVTSADVEIADYMAEASAAAAGTKLTVHAKPGNKASVYHVARATGGGTGRHNLLMKGLRDINVMSNKHIPDDYLHNDRETRLKLLAGLLDSDGSLQNNCFDFVSKHKDLADKAAWLARSLGLAAYVSPTTKTNQTPGFSGDYFRVSISGHTDMIPTKVARKVAPARRQQKNVLNTGFTIEPMGDGYFHGFTLEGDGLYLLEDFTVTHNSGKGFAIKNGPGPVKALKEQAGAVWDAAGEQNGTENPWILAEAKKRGIKANFLFVDADPNRQWDHPKLGVVSRAATPGEEGRMVDAQLFADSYELGAKNFKAFQENAAKDDPEGKSAKFVFVNTWDVDDKGFPIIKESNGVDDRATSLDGDKLAKSATERIKKSAPTEAIKNGATVGENIWGEAGGNGAKPEGAKPEEAKATAAFSLINMLYGSPKVMTKTSAGKEDKALEELKKTLINNFKENLGRIDEFMKEQTADKQEELQKLGLVRKDGKLALPKADGEKSSASAGKLAARVDLVAEKAQKLNIPASVKLALEQAADAVNTAANPKT